jgi:cyclopropane-fatty-acyl-phospholipid synthase
MPTEAKPAYEKVQAIYDDDHSPAFLEFFLDRTMVYSCAYFERDDMTLEEAQIAKIDLSLGKCDLKRGMNLLEIGCGYGECALRAAGTFGVNVVAVTPSQQQAAYCAEKLKHLAEGTPRVEVRCQGWQECHDGADRIVSIGALEHIGFPRYTPFFARCYELLPDSGRMLLHCIVQYGGRSLQQRGVEVTHENVLFAKFIGREIFPGGQLSDPDTIIHYAQEAGFRVERTQALGLHYARTLDLWEANLVARRDEAIAMKSQADYDRYIKYFTGCARHFRSGHIDLIQFTLCK